MTEICETVPTPPRAAADRPRAVGYLVWMRTIDTQPSVEPLSGVGPWGRPRVIGDPYSSTNYYWWEGYHWIELNE